MEKDTQDVRTYRNLKRFVYSMATNQGGCGTSKKN